MDELDKELGINEDRVCITFNRDTGEFAYRFDTERLSPIEMMTWAVWEHFAQISGTKHRLELLEEEANGR